MKETALKPDADVLRRVEELLREQLAELGEDFSAMAPCEISLHMQCGVHSSGALSYSWKGEPILDVNPERASDGKIHWRFFSRDTSLQ